MKILKLDLNDFSDNDIETIADYFRRGLVVVYPTDTIYGIGCLAGAVDSVARISKMKGRKKSGYIVLMKDVGMAKKVCLISPAQKKIMEKESAKEPTTFILEAREGKAGLSEKIPAVDGSLAVRLPKQYFLSKILSEVKEPIVSTSLNKSGQEPIGELSSIGSIFGQKPDLVVDAGLITGKKASRIIDIRNTDDLKIIRN